MCVWTQGVGLTTVSDYVQSYLGFDYSKRWLFMMSTFLIGALLW